MGKCRKVKRKEALEASRNEALKSEKKEDKQMEGLRTL